jgi:HD-like signal output (HDOD) protein
LNAPITDDKDATWNRDAFEFVQLLARELSEGKVQIPSYPEVALKVQRSLTNEKSDVNDVVQALGAEPALAMQIMRMANSAALNTSGQQVHDLRGAVNRIGYNMVRAAALSFVMEQLRKGEALRPLRERLQVLWRRSVVVGTVCRIVAGYQTVISKDAAMLVGLLHGVGKLYILTRMTKLPQLLEHEGASDKIMKEWHANIGRALLENWEMPEEFGTAVGEFEDLSRAHRGAVDLGDLLAAAHLLADFVPDSDTPVLNEAAISATYTQTERFWQRIKITREQCIEIAGMAEFEARQMRTLFGA